MGEADGVGVAVGTGVGVGVGVAPPLQAWLLRIVTVVLLRPGGVVSTNPSPPVGIQSRIPVTTSAAVCAVAPLKLNSVWPGAVIPRSLGLTMIVIVPLGL